MPKISKTKLLEKGKIRTTTETIDGDEYTFRSLSALDKAVIEASHIANGKWSAEAYSKSRFQLVACSLVGDDGKPLMTAGELEQLDDVYFNKLLECARKLNGRYEDSAKNSEEATG